VHKKTFIYTILSQSSYICYWIFVCSWCLCSWLTRDTRKGMEQI